MEFSDDKISKQKLAEYLEQWFKECGFNVKLTGDPVWKVLKTNLEQRGNWKNAPRGKPGFKHQNEEDWFAI